ncbi:MAG: aldehyde ferredoxin oxidoreductase family protein [Candidatus Hodarchaeales archaeon]|jgi:aldehyde:ferredoxin oxidoreductase
MPGWTGKYILVDLTHETALEKNLDQASLELYIGGKGLGTYLLAKHLPPRADPLRNNAIVVVTGPLQGTQMPFSGRFGLVSKSPLTGLYLDSQAGGSFGVQLKRAGYDALVVTGTSERPCYISIYNQHVTIEEADDLWGYRVSKTEKTLKERMNETKASVLSIGPAGERLVPIACLTSDLFRNLARGGSGAVFGAKRLKAIIAYGQTPVEVANPELSKEIAKELRKRTRQGKEKMPAIHKHGTSGFLSLANQMDQLPTRNFSMGEFEHFAKIDGAYIEERWKTKPKPCPYCPLACSRVVSDHSDEVIPVPEYESLAMLGANCGIDDAATLIKANHFCNELGLDTISTGNILAFIMECQERGLIKEKEKLHFGDSSALIEMIEKIARREGLGEWAGQGVRVMAQEIGQGSEAFAIHVKGLEMAAWDPRGKLGLGLSYMTAAIGASHLRGWPRTAETPSKSASTVLDSLIEEQNLKMLKDSLIICHFTHSIDPNLQINDCSRLLTAVTGVPFEEADLNQIVQRTWVLARKINQRESGLGSLRLFDQLPSRLLDEPLPSGRAKGCRAFISEEDREKSLSEIYYRRGCDENGIPHPETIKELDLDWFQ